jgi:predicted unusual protein kinase regulating ubiquinone biosynthesis (AarF/ABC1/UbiB family)
MLAEGARRLAAGERLRMRDMLLTAGKDWRTRFARFDVTPIAAASIGQVHRAQPRDLAIKV